VSVYRPQERSPHASGRATQHEAPSCDLAVMYQYEFGEPSESGWGCKTGWASSVCSKPLGNTDQGLCDMTGNLWELVEDWFHENYEGAPADGTAFNTPLTDSKIRRGGDFTSDTTPEDFLHVSYRASAGGVNMKGEADGFRCAR
jgi:formylglycine-generating enzyme required for sulfatase activity